MGAMICTASPASCSLCGSPLPQLLSMPICAVCWSEDPRFRGKACLHSRRSLGRAAQLDRPAASGRAAGLASPALVRASAAGHDRDRKKDAIRAFKDGRLYPCAGGLRGGLARAMTQQADEARAAARILLEPAAASGGVATLARTWRQLNELRDNAQNKGRSSHWGPSGHGPEADGLEQRIESRIESSDRSSQHQPSF
jgi:hypothetical protein